MLNNIIEEFDRTFDILEREFPKYRRPIFLVKNNNKIKHWFKKGVARIHIEKNPVLIEMDLTYLKNHWNSEKEIKNTCMHEAIHTLPNARKHGRAFITYAAIIDCKYPEYSLL